MEKIWKFFKDESGVTMVEYGLLLALIAVVCILVITGLGTNVQNTFQSASDAIGGAS